MTVEDERTPGKRSALNKAAERFERTPNETFTGAQVADLLREQAKES